MTVVYTKIFKVNILKSFYLIFLYIVYANEFNNKTIYYFDINKEAGLISVTYITKELFCCFLLTVQKCP